MKMGKNHSLYLFFRSLKINIWIKIDQIDQIYNFFVMKRNTYMQIISVLVIEHTIHEASYFK